MTFNLDVHHSLLWRMGFWRLWLFKDWLEEKKEKKERYRERLAKPISEIKYLNHVVLVEGCIYSVSIFKKKTFKSLEQALEYCRKIPIEKISKEHVNVIEIEILNPHGSDDLTEIEIPEGLLVRDCKDVLCTYAKERTISIAADLSEVYTEYFTLDCSDNLFDYGLLYGNYPVYTGKELCVSTVNRYRGGASGEMNLFIPELTQALENPNAIYDQVKDVYMAYQCWYITTLSEGRIYDDYDGGFPWWTHPVSSFRNMGKAGVYFDCWDKIYGEATCLDHDFAAYGKSQGAFGGLFRFALLECKARELPEGKEYYTITDKCEKADGLMPADVAGIPIRDSWEKLRNHARKREICIAPTFDEVYWELFELQNEDGQVFHFCFDYALLESNHVRIRKGEIYQTSYWNKVRLGNPLTNAKVRVLSLPDPGEIYDGQEDIVFCCQCTLECSPEDVFSIPLSTLTDSEGI